MAYNLVMELEVSCNNIGKCPWIGHLSELVAHQKLCDKTMKILEENNKKTIRNLSKRFSFNKNYNKESDYFIFSRSERKINKICKETQIMIDNLKKEKEKFFDSTNVKNKDLTNEKVKEEFKQLFS